MKRTKEESERIAEFFEAMAPQTITLHPIEIAAILDGVRAVMDSLTERQRIGGDPHVATMGGACVKTLETITKAIAPGDPEMQRILWGHHAHAFDLLAAARQTIAQRN